MSTSIDIHNAVSVQVLDLKETTHGSSRRTIRIITTDGSNNIEITVYSGSVYLPVIIGECDDE